jgi:hypothetical protein
MKIKTLSITPSKSRSADPKGIEHRAGVRQSGGMTTIRSFTNRAEASLCVSFLESEDIEAVLLDEASFMSIAATVTNPIRLQVPDDEAERAIDILTRLPNTPAADESLPA